MAYVSKEKKAKIAAALKAVMPADWKYSLAVENCTAIRMTIRSAPFNIIESYMGKANVRDAYVQVNEFWLDRDWAEPVLSVLQKAAAALNTDNHNNSDIMTDYVNVGHYVNLHIGAWNKPFQVIAKPKKDKPAPPIELVTTFTEDQPVKPEPETYADLMGNFIAGLETA